MTSIASGRRTSVSSGIPQREWTGETWRHYGEGLEVHLQDLSGRLRSGAYQAKPVRRVYIPKSNGGRRAIGVLVLEDKIVQRATSQVVQAIFETDFKGFSYGSRPGRSAHNALDALYVGILRKKVNWVFDVDVRGFFDSISHEWTTKFFEHRIGDRRVLRHIQKWLGAGVLEDGKRTRMEKGTPQGGSSSPVIANVYLHFVFDLWADQWRQRHARGDVILVRYVDDIVIGFQHRVDAERFRRDLMERFQKFNLELNAGKSRLVEFGRFAASDRRRRGVGKPETFNFLGFTHICGKTRKGKFTMVRQTMRHRLRGKLKELRLQLRRRLHDPVPEVGQWLRSVVAGHFRYYGVPGNGPALRSFREQVIRDGYRTLRRRSQRTCLSWERMDRLVTRWLPRPRIQHPYPDQRLLVTTRGRSPVR